MTGLDNLQAANRRKHERAIASVLAAIDELVSEGQRINVHAVHCRSGVARGFIYRQPELLTRIRELADVEPRLIGPPTARERSSEASLRQRLADALDRIRALTSENDELRQANETLLGENRQLRQRRR